MLRLVTLALVGASLGGCALANRIESQQNYHDSEAKYRNCLAANAPQACEGPRLAMEADERAFNNMSGRSVNVNTLQR